MSEFNRREPKPFSPYVGWSDNKRKRFLRLLIKIARDNTLYGYASMVETKVWDTILDDATKLPPPHTKSNPYHTCFMNFFAKFLKILKKEIDPLISKRPSAEKIAFVFHNHQVFGPAAKIGYGIIQKVLDHDGRLGTISFGSTEDYLPLQAADLFAFYCRKRFTRYLNNKAADEFEQALLKHEKVYLLYLSSENLQDLREKNEKVRQEREQAENR